MLTALAAGPDVSAWLTNPVPRDIEQAHINSGPVHGVVPLDRKLAKDHHVSQTKLTGTGNQGRMVANDADHELVTDVGHSHTMYGLQYT